MNIYNYLDIEDPLQSVCKNDTKLTKKQKLKNLLFETVDEYSSLTNVEDLLALCNTTQEEVFKSLKQTTIDEVTKILVKNNIKIKLETINQLRYNKDANSKKLLLQLSTNEDEYKKINNQWQNPVHNAINATNEFNLPKSFEEFETFVEQNELEEYFTDDQV